jgi:hypothetical protein
LFRTESMPKTIDYAFIVILYLITHLGLLLVLYYTGDDHLIIDAGYSGISRVYQLYGKPELGYLFWVLQQLDAIHPLLLRAVTLITPMVCTLLFFRLVTRETGDRIAGLIAAAIFMTGFVWTSNLFLIIFPYVFSVTALLAYALVAQSSLTNGRFGGWQFLATLVIGAIGVSYEPFVIFVPLIFAILCLGRGIGPMTVLRSRDLTMLAVSSALMVIMNLAWYVYTPANGLYAGINPVSLSFLVQALVSLPWHVAHYLDGDFAHTHVELGKLQFIFIFASLMIAGFLLFVHLKTKGDTQKPHQVYRALAVIALGVVIIGLGLLPFIVAQKVNLKSYNEFANAFGNRHYFLATAGASLAGAGIVMMARRLNTLVFVCFLLVVSAYLAANVNYHVRLYEYYAKRSLVTIAVVRAAANKFNAAGQDTLVIDKHASVAGKDQFLWGWSYWGPYYIWRRFGGDPSVLVVSDLSLKQEKFIRLARRNNYFWYGFPHELNRNTPRICVKSAIAKRPAFIMNYWLFYTDRDKFLSNIVKGVTFSEIPCERHDL